jgi:hypothetical protein
MRTLPPELEAKIDEVKSWMLEGDQDEVARRARVDKTRVSKVLNKRIAPTKKVLDAAIEVMEDNRARFHCSQQMKIA